MAALYGRSIARASLIACNGGIKRSINTSKVSIHLFQISRNLKLEFVILICQILIYIYSHFIIYIDSFGGRSRNPHRSIMGR